MYSTNSMALAPGAEVLPSKESQHRCPRERGISSLFLNYLLLVNVPFFLKQLKQKYNVCLIGHKQAILVSIKLKLIHV